MTDEISGWSEIFSEESQKEAKIAWVMRCALGVVPAGSRN